jgi:A nuclease family of the HNH/ENDO VII superfamily with conserved AHH
MVDPTGLEPIDLIDFIPFVGSARDIYRGIRDGDMTTLAIGVGGLALDIATAGAGGSIIKAGIKAGAKQIVEVGAKAAVKQAATLIAETTLKQGYKLRSALGLVLKDGFQAHHLIPKELLRKMDVVKDAVAAGFDFNGAVNGLKVAANHGPHAEYTNAIKNAIIDFEKANPNYTLKQAKVFMEKLAAQAKEAIIKNGGDVKKTVKL